MKMLFAVASVLVALLPASVADADIIVTFADRVVQAANGTQDFDSSSATSGPFVESASLSRDGGQAIANQISDIQPLLLQGQGDTDVFVSAADGLLQANSTYLVEFSLSEAHLVTGLVGLETTASTTAAASAVFSFSGPGTSIFFDAASFGGSPDVDGGEINVLLNPGDYSLNGRAHSSVGSGVEEGRGIGNFNFALTFTPQGVTVPEPATLSLLLIGGAGVTVIKRIRRRS